MSDRLPQAPGQESAQHKKVTNKLIKSEVKEPKLPRQPHPRHVSVKLKSRYRSQIRSDAIRCSGKVEVLGISRR